MFSCLFEFAALELLAGKVLCMLSKLRYAVAATMVICLQEITNNNWLLNSKHLLNLFFKGLLLYPISHGHVASTQA